MRGRQPPDFAALHPSYAHSISPLSNKSGRNPLKPQACCPAVAALASRQFQRGSRIMKRRDVLKSALAGVAAMAAPRVLRAEGKTITFTPHADLASLDPVWTTADI